MKTTLETEPKSEVTLFYGNKATSSTMFRDELQDLKNEYMSRLNLVYIFTREEQDIDLYNGRIDHEKCDRLFDHWINAKELTAAFICGPQLMTETVRDSLLNHGMEKAKSILNSSLRPVACLRPGKTAILPTWIRSLSAK